MVWANSNFAKTNKSVAARNSVKLQVLENPDFRFAFNFSLFETRISVSLSISGSISVFGKRNFRFHFVLFFPGAAIQHEKYCLVHGASPTPSLCCPCHRENQCKETSQCDNIVSLCVLYLQFCIPHRFYEQGCFVTADRLLTCNKRSRLWPSGRNRNRMWLREK